MDGKGTQCDEADSHSGMWTGGIDARFSGSTQCQQRRPAHHLAPLWRSNALYNLEEVYAQALEQATNQHGSSYLREVKVTLTGTQKESVLPEIRRRLLRLEAQGVKVVVA